MGVIAISLKFSNTCSATSYHPMYNFKLSLLFANVLSIAPVRQLITNMGFIIIFSSPFSALRIYLWVFLSGLQMILEKHDYILVVVYTFSKTAPFIPWTKTTSTQQTTIFPPHIWLHFKLPINIVSNWESCFHNTFRKMLWHLLGSKIHFSTTLYSKIDGHIEVFNCSLIHALHIDYTYNK